MSDNTQINRGTDGDTIATDEIDDVKFQRVKVNFGADGEASDVHSTNPLPIDSARERSVLNAILTELETINFHLNLISGG